MYVVCKKRIEFSFEKTDIKIVLKLSVKDMTSEWLTRPEILIYNFKQFP